MKLRVPHPRLLPITIIALATLIACKSVNLAQSMLGGVPTDSTMVSSALAATAAEPAGPAKEATASKPTSDTSAGKTAPKEPEKGNTGSGPAIAAEAAAPHLTPTPDPSPTKAGDAERALLQDLRSRKLELDARDHAIAEREAVLSAAEHKLSDRVDQLTALQVKLEALETERKQREEANWSGLVKTYETMKPRDAAAIFNDLDLAVLVPVLDRMKDTKAAPILAAMEPERARLVTTKLAQSRSQATTVSSGG